MYIAIAFDTPLTFWTYSRKLKYGFPTFWWKWQNNQLLVYLVMMVWKEYHEWKQKEKVEILRTDRVQLDVNTNRVNSVRNLPMGRLSNPWQNVDSQQTSRGVIKDSHPGVPLINTNCSVENLIPDTSFRGIRT